MSGDRWFRRLLRVLPFDFRSDYGPEIERVFREQRRDAAAQGRAALFRVWWDAFAGILTTGPREHLLQLGQDVRYALRGMRRSPGFAAVAVITLALGIGANTAIFSVVDAVLLQPLPYHQPARLVAVWNRWDGRERATLSDPEYLDYSEQSRTLSFAAVGGAAVALVGPGGTAERVDAAEITPTSLDVLGIRPALGRGFRADDVGRGMPDAIILSHALWRRMFAADTGVIGRTVTVSGRPREIVGVLPPGMLLPYEIATMRRADVLLPLSLDPAAPRNRRGGHYLQAFARLTDGASAASASAELDAIVDRLIRQYPEEHDQGHFGIVVNPLRDDLLGSSRPVLLMLGAAVGLVLLLACANVANLLLARGESRQRELAVRAALGASRFRVARQLLTEACLLSTAGAAFGLVLAYWCRQSIVSFGATALPRVEAMSLNTTVLAFTASLSVGTGLAFGLFPSVHAFRARSTNALISTARVGTDRARLRLRRALIVCQVTIATVLLVASGLIVKSFVRVTRTPTGLMPDGVLTMRLSLPAPRYPERTEIAAFYSRLLAAVRTLPGVRAAGASTGLPLAVASGDWGFDIDGRPRNGTRPPGAAEWYVVTPGYFEALGIPLRHGRLPADADTAYAPAVIFLNESAAAAMFPDGDVIGQRVRLTRTTGAEQPWRTVVGVVADVRHRGLDSLPRSEMFIPYEQFVHFAAGAHAQAMTVVVKIDGDPWSLLGSIRAALREIDGEVAAAQVRDMTSVISASVADRRLNAILIGTFGCVALVLAAIGLYGVISYNVAQQTREIGVRIAIGASRASVIRLVTTEGMRLVLLGLAIGLGVSMVFSSWLSAWLFEVAPRDVPMFATAAVVLFVSGAVASYLPARRATRVNPVRALRAD